jgi:hypothetical protein
MNSPRERIWQIEDEPWLPDGDAERFSGYGVVGLPFAGGHILALRRFPASSLGPAFTAVWHRDPAGRWVIYSTISPRLSSSRFFGQALSDAKQTEIGLRWIGAWSFVVEVPAAGLFWQVRLAESAASRLVNATIGALPNLVWTNEPTMAKIGALAGRLLGTGRLTLTGRTPNGQRFQAIPRKVWTVSGSVATIDGKDLGTPSPLPIQARLGDFALPRRGLFIAGLEFFEPLNPSRHLIVTAGRAAPALTPSVP